MLNCSQWNCCSYILLWIGWGTSMSFTWNLKMIVHINPRVSRLLPSTMSWAPIFSRWTFWSTRNDNDLSTFSRQWIRIFPFVGRGWKTKQHQTLKFDLSHIQQNTAATSSVKRLRCGQLNRGTYQSFTGQHLQQFQQHFSIPQVDIHLVDSAANPGQVWIHPFCESFLLDNFSLIWQKRQ